RPRGPAVTTRRLVVTVCPRERGTVRLPVERGGPPVRMDAARLRAHLQALVARRGLADVVELREGCAGGCAGPGPNVDVAIHAAPRPGERADRVAVGWRTYVYALPTLDCLARVVEDNLRPPHRGRRAP
ncbi:MAG TPA: hypothetical protein VFX28_13895, partial [Methylomirabilota bacterium]|nr:hypothetical protein [Methylomirabilota bacterium]